MRVNVANVDWSPTWSQFFKWTAMAMVAYTGIESIAQLAAESQRPIKTVPRAVMLTMGVLIVVYLGISVVALSAVSPHELGTKYLLNPIAGIVDALPFGKWILSPVVALLAAVVLTVAANAGMIGASRLSFNMGEYYQLPRFFYKIHPRFRTPMVSLLFFAALAGLVVVASRGRMEFLADLYNFGAMIAFFSAHLSLIALRIKKPHLKRPFKIPFNLRLKGYEIPVTAIMGAFATFSVWVLVVLTKPEGRYLGIAWMGLGLIMYFRYRKGKNIQPMGSVTIQQVSIPGYQPMDVKHILVPTRGGTYTESVQTACEIARIHKAKVTALHILEIPLTLPLDIAIPHRMAMGEAILRRADAIAREFNVEINMKIVRSRSVVDTIVSEVKKGRFDLLVIGAWDPKIGGRERKVGSVVEKILRKAPCRVWVCLGKP